ncbi:MAG: hypothetical protein ABMB14_06220 [Myxococcota bacterium]
MAIIEVAVVDAGGAPVDANVTIDGASCDAGGPPGLYLCGEMLEEGSYSIQVSDGVARAEAIVDLAPAAGECHPDGAYVEVVL